jgi:hypothetical protein
LLAETRIAEQGTATKCACKGEGRDRWSQWWGEIGCGRTGLGYCVIGGRDGVQRIVGGEGDGMTPEIKCVLYMIHFTSHILHAL